MEDIVVYRNSEGKCLCFRHAVLAAISQREVTTEIEKDVGGGCDCRNFDCVECERETHDLRRRVIGGEFNDLYRT